jgi:hypothetical protein
LSQHRVRFVALFLILLLVLGTAATLLGQVV